MKVLHLNSFDTVGGASRMVARVLLGLRRLGIDCPLLVNTKRGDDPDTIGPITPLQKACATLRYFIDPLPAKRYQQRTRDLCPQWLPERIAAKVHAINPDIVHLHWVLGGFVRIETLARLNRPIVWTMHDMWPLTGGCHYSDDCRKYTAACGDCPQLRSGRENDLSRKVMRRKERAWRDLDLTLVTHGSWLIDAARDSSLFRERRIEFIMSGLDTDVYKPISQKVARQALNLPPDKKLILFGALILDEPNKGFQLLRPALQKLSADGWAEKVELVVFGGRRPDDFPDLGFASHWLGKLHDDTTLALAYSAADIFTAPSMQDVGPQTVAEAMACGTPCVGFRAGGLPDRIAHEADGYLAEPFIVEDLTRGLAWLLGDDERRERLATACREKADLEFGLEQQANAYRVLYDEILSAAHKRNA